MKFITGFLLMGISLTTGLTIFLRIIFNGGAMWFYEFNLTLLYVEFSICIISSIIGLMCVISCRDMMDEKNMKESLQKELETKLLKKSYNPPPKDDQAPPDKPTPDPPKKTS